MFKFIFVLIGKRIYDFYSRYKFYLISGVIPATNCLIRGVDNIKIGADFSMGNGCKLFSQDVLSDIVIGARVSLNYDVSLNADCGGYIAVGDNTIIGPGSILRASNHKYDELCIPVRDQGHSPGKIIVGNNVWIGANVVILPNVTIGSNAIIGAGSVVTKDIIENTVVAGVPAVMIKKR